MKQRPRWISGGVSNSSVFTVREIGFRDGLDVNDESSWGSSAGGVDGATGSSISIAHSSESERANRSGSSRRRGSLANLVEAGGGGVLGEDGRWSSVDLDTGG